MAASAESEQILEGTATETSAPIANPAALTVEQLARLLGVSVDRVRNHVAAGAPTAAGGTINLVHYAAWLNMKLKENDVD